MASALVFALSLAGFGLLVFGERMGLAPQLAAYGVSGVFLAAACAIALASTTSRLARFTIGIERGAALGLATIVACLLGFAVPLAIEMSADARGAIVALVVGFLAAQIIAPFNPWIALGRALRGGFETQSRTRGALNIVRIAIFAAAALLAIRYFPIAVGRLADAGGWARGPVFGVSLGLLCCLVLLGGAVALARSAIVVIAIALVLVLALFELGEMSQKLDIDVLRGQLALIAGQIPAEVGTWGWMGAWPAAILGFALGLLALQPAAAVASRPRRIVAIAGGISLMLGLAFVASSNAAMLGEIADHAIRSMPPRAWPVFVFDDALRGWLTACATTPEDAFAAARACGMLSPNVPLPAGSISFSADLAMPALALARGQPVILGFISGLLGPLIELVALGVFLHVAATGAAESILYRLLHPGALRSWRLAIARVSLIALVVGLAALWRFDLVLGWKTFQWLLLGFSLTALFGMVAFRLMLFARWLQPDVRPAAGDGVIAPQAT